MIAIVMLMMLHVPIVNGAQNVDAAAAWSRMAQQLEPGTELVVRLGSGQRFRATLLQAEADRLVLQPRTRVPVPPQAIAYDSIVSLERRSGHGGMGAAKAAAIGVGTGVGAFFGMLLILFATIDD